MLCRRGLLEHMREEVLTFEVDFSEFFFFFFVKAMVAFSVSIVQRMHQTGAEPNCVNPLHRGSFTL